MKKEIVHIPIDNQEGADSIIIRKDLIEQNISTGANSWAIRKEGVYVLTDDELKEIITQAHMSGQSGLGIDPSYSEALAYYIKIDK